MLVLKQIALNEDQCPIDESELVNLKNVPPKNAVTIANQLPALQKAHLCQFCYGRAHLHELALHIASTFDLKALKLIFGPVGEIVYEQSRDIQCKRSTLYPSPSDQDCSTLGGDFANQAD